MQNKDAQSKGLTLIELVVSMLLLSIIAIGSFQTFHFSQRSSNSNLIDFQQLQIKQQLIFLEKLKLTYTTIGADSDYELLNCLIEHQDNCELIP